MACNQTDGTMTLFNKETGSNAWWENQQALGIPYIEAGVDGHCQVTFFWRDPEGDERTSSTRHVWINITGVTDHHQQAAPVSLSHLPQTDVWYWQTQLPSTWRGSYCLMPDREMHLFQGQPDMQSLRDWWRNKFPTAQSDTLNPLRGWSGGRGMGVSPLHLPQAPDQQVWQAVDEGRAPHMALQHFYWESERLNNRRSVWIHTTGDASHDRPLAILLDGQFWANSMPIAWPLQQLTDNGELPPAVYVMIDIIDRDHRSRELPCNPEFWQAVQEELLPQVAQIAPYRQSADSTVVSGQSFGGLASVYAALHWPHTFGAAISLSGSFWWPARGNAHGWLLDQLEQGLLQPKPLRFWLEAGRRERLIIQANELLEHYLTAAGHSVSYQPVEGGHDALCWRGGLLNGLKAMWQTR